MSTAFKIAEYAKVHSLEGDQDMSLQNMPLGQKNYFKEKVIHLKARYTFPSVKPCPPPGGEQLIAGDEQSTCT